MADLRGLIAKLREKAKFDSTRTQNSLEWAAVAFEDERIADELEALDAERKREPRQDESGWLIERGGLCFGFCDRRPKWVAVTNDQALRFSRYSDAVRFCEAFRAQLNLENVLITKHLWKAQPSDIELVEGGQR